MDWKNKLKINDGDVVKFVSKFEAGNLGQNERYKYEIVNSQGQTVGSIKYVEYTSIKAPFNQTYSLQQFDIDDNEVVFERW
ncbi:hypothetical protein [Photobacterium iliopiscarium]|uniref:hypothetical protein n=1 Tax=Photobacterium iliopiscarium TaxID=56192 RepID=UPI000D1780F6|nr:hypothetical protein [Photobacterium iliopiscarium]PSU01684.1 hypothetical protein C9I85_00465 [Photobacterium iliopiscarium]PSV83434.1 hypothetical protein C9J51_09070 [Photobacterium iliopiscarium]